MNEAYASGVSWAAIIAGAFVSAALALILVTVGAGLNLSTNPTAVGAGDFTVGPSTIVWLIVIQIVASAMGGYLAGRLRTSWTTIHNDEVYFRDTAHGFLVWAVALVVTASFLASSASSILGSLPRVSNAGASQTFPSEPAQFNFEPNAYFIDSLFRSEHPEPMRVNLYMRAEAARILARGLRENNMSVADRTYLASLISAQTGLSQVAAENRVSVVFAAVQDSVNANRKALARLSLWMFIALLIGAFSASLAATIGGKERDRVQLVLARPSPSM
ncbi:MAG: hypothetical protein JO071_06880 [Deltaproteobacteria bacterium]|nr:hypothetical protein [Deltaproteobacteria bacterium]